MEAGIPPAAPPPAAAAPVASDYPIRYDVVNPERHNRWTTFFRPLLIYPAQLGLIGIVYAVSLMLLPIAWFGILFTGRYPSTIFRLNVQAFRWYHNVSAYGYLLRDNYPPFSGTAGEYPGLTIEVDESAKLSRLTTFFRLILVIPQVIVVELLLILALVVIVIAWFAILFTGRFPQGMYDFVAGVFRWNARVAGYMFLFTDRYPPFSLR